MCVHFSKRQKRANSLRIKFVAPENYQMARQTAGARKAFFSLATFPFLLHRPISNYELVLGVEQDLVIHQEFLIPGVLGGYLECIHFSELIWDIIRPVQPVFLILSWS